MELYKERIGQWLQEKKQDGFAFLQQWVQIPSTQGNEAQAQTAVADKLRQLGMEVDVWEIEGEELRKSPYFCSARDSFQGSPNVVGVLKGTGGGRSIILNGHIDVVPEGDLEQWTDPPYSGAVRDGKMYGRGTTDMKGGSLSLLLAIQAVRELDIRLKGDIIYQSVIEEESGGAGTLAAVLRGYRADAALIPEPTNMRIFPKQQGSMWFRIRVKGRAAHGGTRYEGVSAIEKSMAVVEQIREMEVHRNKRITDPLYSTTPIPVPVNVGVIEGGNWPSSVPDLVKLEGRMGVAPDETIEDAQREMELWLSRLSNKDPWFAEHPPELEWFGARWIPGAIDEEHELLAALAGSYRDVLYKDPVIEASPWGTDGGLLIQAGKTPTLVFGPGETAMAHYPDEYIVLDRIVESAHIIALTLLDWCGVEKLHE